MAIGIIGAGAIVLVRTAGTVFLGLFALLTRRT